MEATRTETAAEMPKNTAPKPPKDPPVRRVGSLTLGVCLIAAGVFFLSYHFIPESVRQMVLEIAPAAGLCLLGGEVLYFAAKPQRWKYDFLSVFICLVLMAGCFCMSFLPIVLSRYSPENEMRAVRISRLYEDALYQSIQKEASDVSLKDMTVWMNSYYGDGETLEDAADDLNSGLGVLRVNVELYGPYDQKAAFAMDCRKLMDVVQQQRVQPTVITFYYEDADAKTPSYTLSLNSRVQMDWTADKMTKEVEQEDLSDTDDDEPVPDAEEAPDSAPTAEE